LGIIYSYERFGNVFLVTHQNCRSIGDYMSKYEFKLENSGVYKIVSKRYGKYYPGSSKQLSQRKSNHFSYLGKNSHHCQHLQNAYNKYGKKNFEFVIIKNNIPENQLLGEEQKLLDIARMEPEMCYTHNYTAYRVEMTPEVRKKLSLALMGRKSAFFGKHHSRKAKILMSKLKKGKPLSEEHKRKISESNKKIDHSFNCKSIQQIDLKTNNIIKIWKSITEASQAFHVEISRISAVCNHFIDKDGYLAKTCRGFKWEFA
jgi:group I intron endonuclease